MVSISALQAALDCGADVVLVDAPLEPEAVSLLINVASAGRRIWICMQAPNLRSMPLRLRDMGVDDKHIREGGFLHAVAWIAETRPGEPVGQMLPLSSVSNLLKSDNASPL